MVIILPPFPNTPPDNQRINIRWHRVSWEKASEWRLFPPLRKWQRIGFLNVHAFKK
jgi:hypothetical protein